MAAAMPPVSKEQAFLETYFQCLQKYAYDKAKELSDKEREALRPLPISAWSMLIVILGGLASAERSYFSLMYLAQNLGAKFFGRKDSLRTNFNVLLVDLRKIEEGSKRSASGSDQGDSLEQLFGHLSGQLCEYITARIKMADFYEQMMLMSQSKRVAFEDLQVMISEILQSYQKGFHHPILSPIKSNFSLECDILSHLIQAQTQLMEWKFLQSLLHLNDAHSKLNSWAAYSIPKEGKRLGFSSSTKFQLPAVYQWLAKFKNLLVAKFGLYFYEVLNKHGPTDNVRSLMAKTNVDFYGRIVQFQRKVDALAVCLVLDTNRKEGKDYVYQGPGYHHPDKACDPPQGMDSYPCVFAYPGERPEKLWPITISILTGKMTELDSFDKVVHVYDEKLPASFFMNRIEPRITLVIIFDCKKSEKDSYINNFINDITSQLRCTRICAAIKPGVK